MTESLVIRLDRADPECGNWVVVDDEVLDGPMLRLRGEVLRPDGSERIAADRTAQIADGVALDLGGAPTDDRAPLTEEGRPQALVGVRLAELAGDRISIGLAAGAGRGPIALAALRAKCVNVIVLDSATAEWVLANG